MNFQKVLEHQLSPVHWQSGYLHTESYMHSSSVHFDKKYDTVKIDSIEHQIVVKGRSGIVYSLFSSDLFTQDIFHILTISVYKDTVDIKIEHSTFRKYIGLRNPKSEDIELKN